ncbi:hypothetical protein E2C01_016271 [Portunus trituberculatus]|uniref:Uncharacterized protein n=1 Tax=Portunus trituberculatus TaxID=210409 RepID=A0A5B7DNY6_PORTR|nr:hypothetical protein [Portunus trituberculatus]
MRDKPSSVVVVPAWCLPGAGRGVCVVVFAGQASSSTDENGAATLSVSLSSLMLATLLAKVYAH